MTSLSQSVSGADLGPDPLEGQALGRYDILHRLAVGGMGVVYAARARAVAGFERLVALKVLHSHFVTDHEVVGMFLDEARLAARIRHPNVVAMLDVCESDAGYFLVMEYIEGHHLFGLLRLLGRLGERPSTRVSLRIVMDALAGLAAAHELVDRRGHPIGLVHRDVSPQNILVGVDGIARLTDFGVAKSLAHGGNARTRAGKLAYMAPEVVRHGIFEQRSDLFAMGVVLWEALTGERLFTATDTATAVRKLLEGEIPKASSFVPAAAPLDEVIAKALARNPEDRYATAREMLQAIEAAAAPIGVASPREVSELVSRVAYKRLLREHVAIESALGMLSTETSVDDAALESVEDTEKSGVHETPRPPRSRSRAKLALASLSALAVVALAALAGSHSHGALDLAERVPQLVRSVTGDASSNVETAAPSSEPIEPIETAPTALVPAPIAPPEPIVAPPPVIEPDEAPPVPTPRREDVAPAPRRVENRERVAPDDRAARTERAIAAQRVLSARAQRSAARARARGQAPVSTPPRRPGRNVDLRHEPTSRASELTAPRLPDVMHNPYRVR